MVDFSNPNICGASPELNSVLEKLNTEKLDVKNKLDEAASTAAAAFKEAKDELAGLKDKLQTIEIPTLPKLNLQAEIKSLTSQIPGTPSFISSLAKIEQEFGDDLKSSGLSLDTLVSDATKAIAGGGDPCALVPNLEKQAGSTEPSVQKPAPVKQAAKPAEPETASKAKQNLNVEVKMAKLANKASSFFTGSVPPTSDTSAFKFPSPNIIKNISVGGAPMPAVVAPTNSSERTNYVPKEKAGIAYKKAKKLRGFAIDPTIPRSNGKFFEKLVLAEDGYYEATLGHKPTKIKLISIFPGENFTRELIDSSMAKRIGLTEPSSIANKQFYYRGYHGRHQAVLYVNGSKGVIAPRTNIAVFGNVVRFFSPIKLSTHPGDIDSGGYVFEEDNPETFALRPSSGDPMNPRITSGPNRYSDVKGNKKYKGGSCLIAYEYLENYDPDYQPQTQKKTVADPVVTTTPTTGTTTTTTTTGGGSTTTTAAGTTTTPSTTTTTTTKSQPKQADVEKKAATVKKATNREFETTKEDLQKIADAEGYGQTVTMLKRHRSGRPMVQVCRPDRKCWFGIGSTPESAFRMASDRARGVADAIDEAQ
jgi:hypothetical protein